MWTIKIYFLRTEDKREAASSDRHPPPDLGPPGHEAAQGRTPRARKRSQPGGQLGHFLRPEEMELIVRVLESRIQKYD
jgi:hypothetical protein